MGGSGGAMRRSAVAAGVRCRGFPLKLGTGTAGCAGRGGAGVRAVGATAGRGRVQVNYVESSKFGDDEAEFLFAPYSTITVVSVELSASNSYFAPHVITLAAAVDNRLEPEDLPLAPWY
jgi:hypothetical protein